MTEKLSRFTLLKRRALQTWRKHTRFLRPRIIVITGAPRSGTHLLNSILNTSTRIPPLLAETSPLISMLRFYNSTISHTGSHPGHYFRDKHEVLEYFHKVIGGFFSVYSGKYGTRCLVIRAPRLAQSIHQLTRILDHGEYDYTVLCMIRDPMDIVTSLRKIKEKNRDENISDDLDTVSSDYISSYYNPVITRAEENDRIHFIRYEDLILRSETEISRIARITGLKLKRTPDWSKTRGHLESLEHSASSAWVTPLYKKDISSTSLGSYKTVLSPEDQAFLRQKFSMFYKKFYNDVLEQEKENARTFINIKKAS